MCSTTDLLARLTEVIDDLASQDEAGQVAETPEEVLAEELVELRRAVDRLEARFAARLAVFDRSRGYRGSGALSTAGWLRNRCGLSGAAASERVRVARQLDHLADTAKALGHGEIGYGHAVVIARTAEDLGAQIASEAEPTLLGAARSLDVGRLRVVATRLRHCVDPDGAHADDAHTYARRRLHLSQTSDGVFVLDGLLDPEGGATLSAALNALTPPTRPGETRTPAQRRADALVELATHRMDQTDLPEVGGQRPHLAVTVSLDTLQHQPNTAGADLEWAGPLPAETARRLGCDASVTRIIFDPHSQPLDIGHTTRTIPPTIRRALNARDRGCTWQGCDRPASWTDAHHIQHWADGGPTSLDNLTLLCRPHHRLTHDIDYQTRNPTSMTAPTTCPHLLP